MSDLFDKVSDARGSIEKLLGQIPGYKGYKEKEMRRESDKLLRELIAKKMEIQGQHLDDLQKQLISGGKFDYLDEMGNAATKLKHFIDRVRKATYGYAGLFDAARVKEDELDRLYDFDNQLLQYVEQLSAALNNLETSIPSGEGLAEAVRQVVNVCADANRTFEDRESAILGSQ